MAQVLRILLGFAYLLGAQGHVIEDLKGKEPFCVSRFDYDFKMLKTMVDIAQENEELRANVAALTARMDELEAGKRTSGVAFYALLSMNLDRVGDHHIVKFDNVVSNVGGAYDSTSGIFEAPQKGTYVFHWAITNEEHSYMNTELFSNGVIYGKAMSDAMNHDDRAVAANLAILTLQKGDQVWIRAGTWHSGKIQGDNYCSFSGYKLF